MSLHNIPKIACWRAAAPLAVFLVLSYPSPAQQTKLSSKPFQIPGAIFTSALAINNSGVIVGWYEDQNQATHGFSYDHGVVTNIDAPNGSSTICLGINSTGAIVGQYTRPNGANIGFLYQNGTLTDVDPFPPDRTSAGGINDQGQIVGSWAMCGFCTQHGYLWDGTKFTSFDAPGTYTGPSAINNAGIITVISASPDGRNHGYLYDGATFTNIDIPGVDGSLPHGINNFGDVAYDWYGKDNIFHGALLHNGQFYKFDAPGQTTGGVSGINDQYFMVGSFIVGTTIESAGYHY